MSAAYDAELLALVRAGEERLVAALRRDTPALAARLLPWLESLSATGRLADYFTHPRRFPMLLLPWWVAEAAGTRGDRRFHGDVVYSTMSAYYYVRLIDDVVDARGSPGLELLPAAAFLHTECLTPYLSWFAGDSPFWTYYREIWMRATDAAADDVAAPVVDLESFADRAVRRIGPATIPMAAVCLRAGRPDLLEPWSGFVRDLCRVEQLLDDFTDWRHDAERGLGNLLLAEGARRARAGEPVEAWVLRDGLLWALATAREWATALRGRADALGSAAAERHLAGRLALIAEAEAEVGPGVAAYRRLDEAFGEPQG